MAIDWSVIVAGTIGGILILYFMRLWLGYKASIARQITSIERQKGNKVDIEGMFKGVPTALSQLQIMYEEQKKAGATPDVLKVTEGRINQLMWVQHNEWWLRAAAPYAEKILNALSRMF